MPDFELAKGWIRLGADGKAVDEEFSKLRTQLLRAQDDLRSGYFAVMNQKFRALEEQYKAINKQAERQIRIMREGRVGTILAEMADKAKAFGDRVTTATNWATVGFAGLTAGLMAASSAASPAAYNTLTQSIQLLTGEIGSAFLPVLVDVIAWTQRAYQWFNSLSSAQKEAITYWTKMGLGILFVIGILPRLIALGGALLTLLKGINVALTMIHRHPIMMLLGAVAGVTGIIAASQAYQSLIDTQGEPSERRATVEAAAEIDPEIKFLQYKREVLAQRLANNSGWLRNAADRMLIGEVDKQINARVAAVLPQANLRKEPAKGRGLLTDYSSMYQPQYMGDAMAVYRATQLAGLGKSPIEVERELQTRRFNETFFKLAKDVEHIANTSPDRRVFANREQ